MGVSNKGSQFTTQVIFIGNEHVTVDLLLLGCPGITLIE